MSTPTRGDVLVVGVGRFDRRDDAVGLVVAAALREKRLPCVDMIALAEPISLLEARDGYGLVVVIDAVLSGRPGGSLTVEEVGDVPLSARLGRGGTHTLGLPEVVELGRALGSLPARLTIVGVEAADIGLGIGLSPLVAAAVAEASQVVEAVVRSATGTQHPAMPREPRAAFSPPRFPIASHR